MPLVIGHRGASADFPENTIDAFRGARAQGADWVELDVRRTADGVLVVHHDPAVASGAMIVQLAASDLPESVPTLLAALDACAGMGVNVEIKSSPLEPEHDPTDGFVSEILAVIAESGHPEILISSFEIETINAVRRHAPSAVTGFLVLDPAVTDDVDPVATAVEGGHAALHPWNICTTEATVEAAHRAGLMVNVWTVDDADRVRQLAGWGVDGIITNRPAATRAALESL